MEFSMCEKNYRCVIKLKEFNGLDFPEGPEQTHLASPEQTAESKIVQWVSAPLKRI